MDDQIQCPNCRSFKVKLWSKSYKILLGIVLVALGVVLYYLGTLAIDGILVIALPLGFCSILVGLFYLAKGLVHKKDLAICRNCKKKFNPERAL